ncbi:flippase [Paradesulfitobacterium aromaticivorans]
MLSGVIWVALSRIILGLAPLITLPALTRAFAPEWYGVWAQILITNSFIVPLLGMGLDMGVIRYFAVGFTEEERVRDFYSMGTFIFLTGAAILGIAYFNSGFLSFVMFSERNMGSLSVLTFIWVTVQALYNYLISFFRVTNHIKTYAVFDMINGLISALLMVSVPLLSHSVEKLVIALIINQAFFMTLFTVIIHSKIGFKGISFRNITKYLKYGLPLVPNSFFLWMVNSSGRYFLTHFRGLADVGIYAAGMTIANVMTLFFMPISFVLFPVISKLWEEENHNEVRNKISLANLWYLALAIPGALGLSFLAKPIVGLISAKDFQGSADIILLLTIANLFYGVYQINLYGLLLLQKNIYLTSLFAAAGVLNILLNFGLVPIMGTRGAALAMGLSFFLLAMSVLAWSKREIHFNLHLPDYLKLLFSALLMLGFLWLWRVLVPEGGVFQLLLQIVLGALVYLLLIAVTGVLDLKTLLRRVFG